MIKLPKKQIVEPKGVWTFEIRDAKTNKLKRRWEKNNIIPTIGRSALACQISGQATYEAEATYIAIGTGTGEPVNADTTLGTETYRKAMSSGNYASTSAYISGFFTAAEVTGDFKEFGIFGDGIATQATGDPDVGILYSRVLENISKDATETLTISWTISFT